MKLVLPIAAEIVFFISYFVSGVEPDIPADNVSVFDKDARRGTLRTGDNGAGAFKLLLDNSPIRIPAGERKAHFNPQG